TAAARGHGLANTLAAEMLVRARAAGASEFRLEVLTRNHVAIKVYERIGMRPLRRLRVLAWRPDDDTPQPDPAALTSTAPADLVLNHFNALHPVAAAWQREPASLLSSDGCEGLALVEQDQLHAYAIVSADPTQRRILDFAAADNSSADALLARLQAISSSLVSVNEPAESPLTNAFARAGFHDADEQHEMVIDL
ncbi:MAG: GNAT family N-acetyltransferase, partial [Oscillochloris sp.]|nr:GNAT family N-acetyltransferase [Oscillochloris sp.]